MPNEKVHPRRATGNRIHGGARPAWGRTAISPCNLPVFSTANLNRNNSETLGNTPGRFPCKIVLKREEMRFRLSGRERMDQFGRVPLGVAHVLDNTETVPIGCLTRGGRVW